MEELKGSSRYINENVENVDGEEVMETRYACEFHLYTETRTAHEMIKQLSDDGPYAKPSGRLCYSA
jgi:hypothetical protein